MLQYCHGRYKTPEMCEKAVDAYSPSLKFVPDWFVAPKMLVTVDNAGLDKLITWCNRINNARHVM